MSDKKLIAVCGATGSQGGSVLKYLVESGRYKVRALTRNVFAAKALWLKKYGNDVELWKCDMTNPDEVIRAFEGCWGAYLLTDFWDDPQKMIEKEFDYGRILIDAAVTAKLTFAVFSSLPNVDIIAEGKYQVPHFTNKNMVEEYARNEFKDKNIETAFGFVYPGFYMQNFMNLPGMGLKLNEKGELENEPLPINEDTLIPMINIKELGKWVLPMFDQYTHFKNNIVYASNDYITIPRFLEIIAKSLGIGWNYKKVSSDEYYKITQNNELVHMCEYFNEYGYYNGAQLGNFRLFAPDVLPIEDAILSLDWKSVVKPGLTHQLTSKIGETLGSIKETIVDTASHLREKMTGQTKTDQKGAESAF